MIKYYVMKEGYILIVFKNECLSWLLYIVIVILLYVIGFSFLWIVGKDYYILFGMGIFVYILGLCYVFDVDHIVVIDNMVCKLL